MKLVVDTNIVFSALLKIEGRLGNLLLKNNVFEFCTTERLNIEIEKHRERVITHSKMSLKEFELSKESIYDNINFYYEKIIPFEVWYESLRLVRDTDINDISFVALTEFLDAKLWTGDKKLIDGLRAKGYDKCLTTDEVYDLKNIIESSNF